MNQSLEQNNNQLLCLCHTACVMSFRCAFLKEVVYLTVWTMCFQAFMVCHTTETDALKFNALPWAFVPDYQETTSPTSSSTSFPKKQQRKLGCDSASLPSAMFTLCQTTYDFYPSIPSCLSSTSTVPCIKKRLWRFAWGLGAQGGWLLRFSNTWMWQSRKWTEWAWSPNYLILLTVTLCVPHLAEGIDWLPDWGAALLRAGYGVPRGPI